MGATLCSLISYYQCSPDAWGIKGSSSSGSGSDTDTPVVYSPPQALEVLPQLATSCDPAICKVWNRMECMTLDQLIGDH